MNPYKSPPPRKTLETRTLGARIVMLVSVALTALNIIIAVASSHTQFLYSISVPYYGVLYGKGMDNNFVAEGAWPVNGQYTWLSVGIAALILAAYTIMTILSKRHYGWAIAVLVLFSLDALALIAIALLLLSSAGTVAIEFCIHLWIIYLLGRQVHAGYQLHQLDELEEYIDTEENDMEETNE